MSLRASLLERPEKNVDRRLPYLKRAACFGVSSEYSIKPVRPLSSTTPRPSFPSANAEAKFQRQLGAAERVEADKSGIAISTSGLST
jgi:hypothetical protein